MLSLFCLALFAHTITSLPALSSPDDAGLLSANLGLDSNQLSTVGTDPGSSFSSLDAPQSDNLDAFLSQPLALNVDSLASAPPLASQITVDPACDKTPNSKRETGGADTSCPALFINPRSPGTAQEASPKKIPEGQQQQQPSSAPQGPTNVKPKKPGETGDMPINLSDEPIRIFFGGQDKDPQCPPPYKYTVCGIADRIDDNWWVPLHTIHDADLVINSGFDYGKVIRPGK